MKTIPRLVVIVLSMTAFMCVSQQATAQTEPGFSITAGLKTFEVKGTTFRHDTHKEDGFLPNSNVPGSAGTTSLDGGRLYFGSLGARYTVPVTPITKRLSWSVELGGLGGGEYDGHKNNNDPRPDSNAAFVYSQARWGFYGSSGLTYDIKKFYIGGEVQFAGLFMSSGWDRYSRLEAQHRELKTLFTAGPKLGYNWTKGVATEATLQFGETNPLIGFDFIFRF